jgi:GT2 family glycosyltransferase
MPRSPNSLTAVSVIVPCRDAERTIAGQLEALASQDYAGPIEVIVADNGSTDRSVEVARGFPGVVVVDAPAVRGPNHARNAGAGVASGDLILTCDADDVAGPGWVSQMVAALEGADLVGGRLDYARLNPATQEWPDPHLLERPRFGFLRSASGANFGIRREVLESLGGWDESVDGGPDDTELCWRAQLAGYRFAYVPGAVVHYRLRHTGRALARQGYEGGLRLSLLFGRFRGRGLPLLPIAAVAARHAAYLASMWPVALVSRRHRLEWSRRLGIGLGFVRGVLGRRSSGTGEGQ